ncbi:MAG: hypothetical protein FJ276_30975, partial [Planctomycetes bacterium]|nr:hypothetical protein [Planctomycetota bacterium]
AYGKFDFSRPAPAFWRQFEQRILDLQKLNIEADLILWHPYDRWGFARMSDEQDDRYLRYCIARLGAFRNVWWSLANEFDFMSNLDGKHPGRKTMDDWDRFFAILQREDPHQRLRGIHNGATWYDHASEPLVRAGFAAGEVPALKFHGTAKRAEDGSLRLPGGAPWGWVAAGEGVLDDLRGLRSFTIMGWLKPESLEIGSGGNRVVFCLNGSHSGIDLVCHADGRLRLAVNEWPDGIRNDSSPGRLQIGKWTIFAVTYDATRADENVNWYFSAPQDGPEKAALARDRKTTYNPGPVGTDIGPLAIGNFNPTMHRYGLDRQFRGEIRGLQLFGSRVSGRGALDQATLEGLLNAGRQGRNQSGAAAPDTNQREIASSCAVTVAGRASAPPSLAARSAPLLAAATACAENWAQFRGPTGQGHSTETGLPLKWSATENVVWKTPIPGESWSSPIVWGDRVFLTTATDNGQSCRVLALERESGAIAWNKEVFRQVPGHKQDRNTYATPTPATDGERVVACFGDGSFAALNFAGDVVWTNRDYMHYSEHGLASSLLLYRGLLIMARDGSSDGEDKSLGWQEPWDRAFIVALDVRTGQQRWTARRGLSRISHGVPAIWERDGKAELVSEAGDVVQGFSLETGERFWSSQVIGEGKVPSTLIAEGLVFTAGGWGGRESIKAFRLGGSGELQETRLVWEQKKGMPKVPSMLYVNSHLFAITDNGIATCLKAATGEVVWQERLGGNFSASPVSAEGRIYFVSDEGETTVIDSGPTFHVLAKNPLGEKVQASPALSQGRIFIRTERHLFCIGAK